MPKDTVRNRIVRETALFTGLLFVGFVLVPVAIYLIGPHVLGEFAGNSYGDFFGDVSARVRSGDLTAWFFILSPWLVWQVARLTLYAWQKAA